MATNPLNLVVPVYTTEMAGSVMVWINQMIKRARSIGATELTFEFLEGNASACREVIGPIQINGITLRERTRSPEEGTSMWVAPYPPDRQPVKREVTIYPQPSGETASATYSPEPASIPTPKPKSGRGVAVDPQQPAQTVDNDPFAGGTVTRVRSKKS